MLVDIHCHVMPEGIEALAAAHGIAASAIAGPPPLASADACFGRVGADGWTIASPAPSLFRYELDSGARFAAALNDGMLAAAGDRPRTALIGWLPLQSPEAAIAEARRLAAQPRIVGVAVGTAIGLGTLRDPALDPVWKVVAEHDLAVFVHPNADAMPGALTGLRPQVLGFPASTTGALLDLLASASGIWDAGVRLCLSHGGGFLIPALGRAVQAGAWQSPAELDRRLACVWVDGVLFDERWLAFLRDYLGDERVLPGTDWPFQLSLSPERLERQSSRFHPDPLAAVAGWSPRLARAS